jgi:UDP-N-acetyl-D-glucosamine dehydrogenase
MGQGYVGLPMAMRAIEVGHTVIGFEPDRNRLASLKAGTSYVEDVASETLQAALASGRYIATNDPAEIAGFDVARPCVCAFGYRHDRPPRPSRFMHHS